MKIDEISFQAPYLLNQNKVMKKKVFNFLWFGIFLFSIGSNAQSTAPLIQSKLYGKVVDKITNEAVIGASVLIKGTTHGVNTDENGKFYFQTGQKFPYILLISYLGYKDQELIVNGSPVTVALSPNVEELKDLVVVGFGVQKKTNVSGATTTVKMDQILGSRPVTNANSALQGVVAGLQVFSTNGQPGNKGTQLELRGLGSISAATPPLILVDNVKMSMSDINPSDIQTVTVLKDAAATAIYGAKGAWGVILITTKKPARDQKTKFEYKTSMSLLTPTDLIKKTSVSEFVNMLNDVGVNRYWSNQNVPKWLNYLEDYKINPGKYPNGRILDPTDGFYYPLAETDPIGAFMDNAGTLVMHDFAFSGGSKKISYRVAYGYSDEDGVIVTDKDSYKKYNLNAFLDADLAPKLKSTTNIFYTKGERSDPIGKYDVSEADMPYFPTGYWTLPDGSQLPFNSPDNFERLSPHPTTKTDVTRLLQRLTYNSEKGFKITGDFTYEKGTTVGQSINSQLPTFQRDNYVENIVNPEKTSVTKSFSEYLNKTLNIYANYDISIKETHNFGLMAGYNREQNYDNAFSVDRSNLLSTEVPSVEAAIGLFGGTDAITESAVNGYFGRLQYNYKEKYFVEGNIRYDGSSKFPAKDRYGVFASFSAAWNAKEEAFLKDVNWLSLLKFRGSYGEIGNQNVGSAYPYISQWTPKATWMLNEAGERVTTIAPGSLVSPSLTWETVQKTNFALDAAFLKNRLSTTFEVYRNRTLDMLVPAAELPAVLGADAPVTNAGDLETKGWEVDLSWRDNAGGVSYGLNFNISDYNTVITRFDNPGNFFADYYVGKNIGEIWGYVTDRYYTVDDFVPGTLDANLVGDGRQLLPGIPKIENAPMPYPGDIKYVDLNGDGVINGGNGTLVPTYDANGVVVPNTGPGDQKIIGSGRRKLIYGFNGNVAYKGFDISFALSGVGKRDFQLTGNKSFPYQGQFGDIFAYQLDYWTVNNQDAFYPRMFGNNTNFSADRGNYASNQRTQTKYLYNGAYLKINNVTIGYNLPTKFLEKINLNKIRLALSCENLYTFKDLPKGITPERNGATSTYPFMRTFALATEISF